MVPCGDAIADPMHGSDTWPALPYRSTTATA
jgi:hypothetical protein